MNGLAYGDEHNAFWELFSDVMQHLGCAMQAIEDKRDLDLPPGLKPSAPRRRLQTGEADVAAMSFGLALARMRNMTPSATFKTDRIVVLVTESRLAFCLGFRRGGFHSRNALYTLGVMARNGRNGA